MLGIAFIKAQPTTYLLQYRGGKVVREGAGLSFFYYGPTSTVSAVPVGSQDEPFIFELVTHDFQSVTVQGQVAYRVSDPRKAASMLDFALRADGRTYVSDDYQKLPERVSSIAEVLIQQTVKNMAIKDALRASEVIATQVASQLGAHPEVVALGLEVLGVSVLAIKPTPETARALEAEARETILRTADEAIFSRRNAAVEQERAIRESELDTEVAVELKKRLIPDHIFLGTLQRGICRATAHHSIEVWILDVIKICGDKPADADVSQLLAYMRATAAKADNAYLASG